MALFTTITTFTTPAQAQAINDSKINVVWSGDNLTYDGITLSKSASPQNDNNLPTLDSAHCGGTVFYSPVRNMQSPAVNDKADEQNYWLSVICFEAGDDGTDKSQPSDAMLYEYSIPRNQFNPATDSRRKFTKALAIQIIIPASKTTANNEGATSCDSSSTHGLGWIVCPLTNFLADGMDKLFDILTHFLVVQPASTDLNSPLYRAWSIMRNLANVLFVVGFLVIIYSQITTVGLSNYGIKRLLPRLVIAAIFVNISYWLCAAAVDISNILGFALQQMFVSIRNSITIEGATLTSWQVVSWGSVAGYILSAGAAVAGLAAVGIGAGIVGVGATIMLLLPILLGALLSALVAILVLAARQALITILIIVSPFACVAYLLPNTEKYFERWRELFGTMLLVFPIFAIVFGGSQLAGLLIITNAPKGDPNQMIVILLGMAVQVAPLAITPLLLKVSGALLGRFAGMVNNPNKGFIDKTRNFTNERRAYAKARRMGEGFYDNNGNWRFRNSNPALGIARRLDRSKRSRAGYQKAYEASLESDYKNTEEAHRVHAAAQLAHLRDTNAESEAEYLFNREINTNAGVQMLDLQSRLNQQRAANAKAQNDVTAARLTARPDLIAADMAARAIADEMQEAMYTERNLGHRLSIDKRGQENSYNSALLGDQSATATAEQAARARRLRELASDTAIDPESDTRILNIAQEAEQTQREARITSARATLGREEATFDELVALTTGHVPASGRFARFASDNDSRSAALRQLVDSAPEQKVLDAMEQLDLSRAASANPTTALIRSEFAAALKKRKPFWVPESIRGGMAEGTLPATYNGLAGRNLMILDTLNKFGLDPEQMVSADRDDLQAVADFFTQPEAASLSPEARARLIKNFDEAFDPNGRYAGRMAKRRVELNNIRDQMHLPRIP
jgi:hypothetical protein